MASILISQGPRQPLSGTCIAVKFGEDESDKKAPGEFIDMVAGEKKNKPDMIQAEVRAVVEAQGEAFEQSKRVPSCLKTMRRVH